MDALCVQTRADLEADPNALEFFNIFFSKQNVSKMKDLQQQIREGYEPGGHRMSALRGSLAAAADILAAAFSGSFFSHTGRSNIGAFCCFLFKFQIFLLMHMHFSTCVLHLILGMGIKSQPSQDFGCVRCDMLLLKIWSLKRDC
jgi:hypothetical protein